MRTRKMIVPRSIVKRHVPHPEYYGESIVELANGMATDVYTLADGLLYTITNNEDLIKYLEIQEEHEKEERILFTPFTLTNIQTKDAKILQEWFLVWPFRRAQSIDNELCIVLEYISHAKTLYSNVYLVSMNTIKVGLLGFTVLDGSIFVNCDLFERDIITEVDVAELLNGFIEYLTNLFDISDIRLRVFEFDTYLLAIVNERMRKPAQKTAVLLPTLNGHMYQYEFQFVIR